jgi:hypothetical protein
MRATEEGRAAQAGAMPGPRALGAAKAASEMRAREFPGAKTLALPVASLLFCHRWAPDRFFMGSPPDLLGVRVPNNLPLLASRNAHS